MKSVRAMTSFCCTDLAWPREWAALDRVGRRAAARRGCGPLAWLGRRVAGTGKRNGQGGVGAADSGGAEKARAYCPGCRAGENGLWRWSPPARWPATCRRHMPDRKGRQEPSGRHPWKAPGAGLWGNRTIQEDEVRNGRNDRQVVQEWSGNKPDEPVELPKTRPDINLGVHLGSYSGASRSALLRLRCNGCVPWIMIRAAMKCPGRSVTAFSARSRPGSWRVLRPASPAGGFRESCISARRPSIITSALCPTSYRRRIVSHWFRGRSSSRFCERIRGPRALRVKLGINAPKSTAVNVPPLSGPARCRGRRCLPTPVRRRGRSAAPPRPW